MKLSIIIPVYNVCMFLRETLDSVIRQTYEDIEIICVDDGSTDGSSDILTEYATKDNRIHVISQPNSGTYKARQKGIGFANGDYIIFLDGDDWLDPKTCEQVAACIEDTHADIIQYGAIIESSSPESSLAHNCEAWINVNEEDIHGSDNILEKCFISHTIPGNIATKAIKTENAKKAQVYRPSMKISTLEDSIAFFYILLFSEHWHRIDAKLYHYRLGGGTSTKTNISLTDVLKSLNPYKALIDMRDYTEKNATSETAKIIVNKYLLESAVNDSYYYYSRLSNNVSFEEVKSIWSDDIDHKDLAYILIGIKYRSVLNDISTLQHSCEIQQQHINYLEVENKRLQYSTSVFSHDNKRLQLFFEYKLIKWVFIIVRKYRNFFRKTKSHL